MGAVEILEKLPPHTDAVTVYRTLNTFTAKGVAHRVRGEDRVWRYALGNPREAATHHHPHFVCENCGKVECLKEAQIPSAFVNSLGVGTRYLVRYTRKSCPARDLPALPVKFHWNHPKIPRRLSRAPVFPTLAPFCPLQGFPMNKLIRGKAFVLGDNIDTDQIIPAKFLAYNPSDPAERKYFGMYAMDGLPKGQSGLPFGDVRFVRENEFKSDFTIVIGGKNFGCGSSREHAPLAIAEAGAVCVVAEFYARIFFRNCVNGGYLVPLETDAPLIHEIKTGDELVIDLKTSTLTNVSQGNKVYPLNSQGDVVPIIEAGGVFEYAKQSGMLAR